MMRLLALLALGSSPLLAQHQATLYWQSPACTTATPCQLAVYRTVCSSPTTCPGYGNGKNWTRLTAGSASSTPTATGTQWVVIDKDPALKDATTYAYVAISAWTSNGQTSQPSPPWSGTTSGGINVPNVPTIGTGNSVH